MSKLFEMFVPQQNLLTQILPFLPKFQRLTHFIIHLIEQWFSCHFVYDNLSGFRICLNSIGFESTKVSRPRSGENCSVIKAAQRNGCNCMLKGRSNNNKEAINVIDKCLILYKIYRQFLRIFSQCTYKYGRGNLERPKPLFLAIILPIN